MGWHHKPDENKMIDSLFNLLTESIMVGTHSWMLYSCQGGNGTLVPKKRFGLKSSQKLFDKALLEVWSVRSEKL